MDLSALLCVVYAKEAPVKIQLTSPWKLSMTAAIEGDIYRSPSPVFTCLGRQALAHRGFDTRRLPSPSLAGLPKPLPGVWPLSHANSYREPQVGTECRVETIGGRAVLKRTWQPPSQRSIWWHTEHVPEQTPSGSQNGFTDGAASTMVEPRMSFSLLSSASLSAVGATGVLLIAVIMSHGCPSHCCHLSSLSFVGATGVLLIAVICIMYIFAQPIVRAYIFNAFWVSHKLFYLLYVLILLHGCVRLFQEPNFSYYFAGPAILFTLDKIVSLSRRKRELTILRMKQLPSDITYLEFRRPANFEYKSGQWVRLACTALGKEEYHSLTLASAPHENTLSVYVMACGPWSWNLKRLTASQNQSEDPYPKIYIDGPFGTGHQDWYDFEVTILIGGGIGITPYASILKEFVHMSTIKSMYRMKCRKVYFVWVAGNQRHFEWMTDVLRQIESVDTKETVETHLFITQLFQNFDLRTTML
ncbi:Dual oxidase 2, partial [Lamellibrachia satsuma]